MRAADLIRAEEKRLTPPNGFGKDFCRRAFCDGLLAAAALIEEDE